MSVNLKALSVVAITLLTTATSFAVLPEGSYKAKSNLIKDKEDVMALIIKKDTSVPEERYHAIVSEYERIKGTAITEKTALTRWVPRMYIYRLEKVNSLEYSAKQLMVTRDGQIEVNQAAEASVLKISKSGSLENAVFYRVEKGRAVETINKFDESLSSTIEPLVVGNYYGTNDSTGGDYMKKSVNANISKEGNGDVVLSLFRKDLRGRFTLTEQLPGLFTLQTRSDDNSGAEAVLGKIVVFVDIVNWKSFGIQKFTTEEMLIINPDNAKDIGFYYERHLPEGKEKK